MKRIHTVNLPDIGEGVVEGEVLEWLKAVGDPVSQDEPVVIVMTDKATVELPAPAQCRQNKIKINILKSPPHVHRILAVSFSYSFITPAWPYTFCIFFHLILSFFTKTF